MWSENRDASIQFCFFCFRMRKINLPHNNRINAVVPPSTCCQRSNSLVMKSEMVNGHAGIHNNHQKSVCQNIPSFVGMRASTSYLIFSQISIAQFIALEPARANENERPVSPMPSPKADCPDSTTFRSFETEHVSRVACPQEPHLRPFKYMSFGNPEVYLPESNSTLRAAFSCEEANVAIALISLSTLVSLIAARFWFRRYISGKSGERLSEVLSYEGGGMDIPSLISSILSRSIRKWWNFAILSLCVVMFGALHAVTVISWKEPAEVVQYALYLATLAVWAVFLSFPSCAVGEVVLIWQEHRRWKQRGVGKSR